MKYAVLSAKAVWLISRHKQTH